MLARRATENKNNIVYLYDEKTCELDLIDDWALGLNELAAVTSNVLLRLRLW